MEDWMLGTLFGLAIVAIVIGLPVAGIMWDAHMCKTKASLMGLESRYSLSTDCMVRVGDRWAPFGFIRIVDNKVIIQGDGEE